MKRPPVALVVVLATVSAACTGGAKPATPTSGSPSTPSNWTLTGQVISTANAPVSGAAVQYAGHQATTDAAGQFTVTHQVASTSSLTLSHSSILERRVWLNGAQTRTVALDPIALTPPFNPEFYRQLARDTLDGGSPRALRRWTVEPRFYIRTTEDSGAAIDGDTLTRVRDAITAGVQHFSPFGPPHIETGADDRPESQGWIIVRLHRRWQSGDPCGRATVGGNEGWISMYLDNCRCPGERSRAPFEVVVHEVGHTMGFWHVDGEDGRHAMQPVAHYPCNSVSAAERFHARIAYKRPVGNTDPDHDPSSGAFSLAEAGPAPVVSCHP